MNLASGSKGSVLTVEEKCLPDCISLRGDGGAIALIPALTKDGTVLRTSEILQMIKDRCITQGFKANPQMGEGIIVRDKWKELGINWNVIWDGIPGYEVCCDCGMDAIFGLVAYNAPIEPFSDPLQVVVLRSHLFSFRLLGRRDQDSETLLIPMFIGQCEKCRKVYYSMGQMGWWPPF